MPPRIIDCEQNSPEWFAARAGIPTASEFATVMAKGVKAGTASKTRRTYMLKLAGERLTGELSESYSNVHMERGHEMEEEARSAYAFITGATPQSVGFVRNDDAGCSPDALLGEDGVLELKTALPHVLLDKLLRGTFPPEHKAQCQGALWVCEREWIDLAIFWPALPLFITRAHRDEEYIRTLADTVARFNEELAETVARVERYRGNPKAALRNDLEASVEAAHA